MNYKRILLAADLVPEDDNPVAKRAAAIAKANDAELSIVHAVEYVYTYGVPPAPINLMTWQKELEQESANKLEKLAAKFDVPSERQYLPVGPASKSILEVAEEIDADLIVVGSHSRHGLEVLLGSTANSILQHATCDVLAVRCRNS